MVCLNPLITVMIKKVEEINSDLEITINSDCIPGFFFLSCCCLRGHKALLFIYVFLCSTLLIWESFALVVTEVSESVCVCG